MQILIKNNFLLATLSRAKTWNLYPWMPKTWKIFLNPEGYIDHDYKYICSILDSFISVFMFNDFFPYYFGW